MLSASTARVRSWSLRSRVENFYLRRKDDTHWKSVGQVGTRIARPLLDRLFNKITWTECPGDELYNEMKRSD